MNIKWYGHACFQLTENQDFSIVTDPFDGTMGYPRPPLAAQVVTISHGHHDHDSREWVRGNPVYLDKITHRQIGNVRVDSFPSFHDEQRGKARGNNLIFTFLMDGLRVCHLGDLGHQLDDTLRGQIGKVDVLLIPVGGTYTLDGPQAYELVRTMKPRITVPMHYKTPALTLPIDGVEPFLEAAGAEAPQVVSELSLDAVSLPEKPQIVLMDWRH